MGQDSGTCYDDCYYDIYYSKFCRDSYYDDCGAYYYPLYNYYTRVYHYEECPSPGDCGLSQGAVITLYVSVMILLCCFVAIMMRRKYLRNEARQTAAARNLAAAERERARLERIPVDAEILTDEKLTLMVGTPIRYSEVEAGTPAEQRPS